MSMDTTQRIEAQMVHRPIPADHMECPDCFGLWWSDGEECERCEGRCMIPALCLDGESGCTCARCEAEAAHYKALYGDGVAARDHEGATYRGCRDCGDNCHCYRGMQP